MSYKEYSDKKSEVLYRMLFVDKVKKLGNLDIEQHDDYVIINSPKPFPKEKK
jgi:hypothetical protein